MADVLRILPLYLLLDTSASMSGEPMEKLRRGVERFLSGLRADPLFCESVYVSVIAFGSGARRLCPLTRLADFTPPALAPHGVTSLSAGLAVLSDSLSRDARRTSPYERDDWRPVALVFTDGAFTDPGAANSNGVTTPGGANFGSRIDPGAANSNGVTPPGGANSGSRTAPGALANSNAHTDPGAANSGSRTDSAALANADGVTNPGNVANSHARTDPGGANADGVTNPGALANSHARTDPGGANADARTDPGALVDLARAVRERAALIVCLSGADNGAFDALADAVRTFDTCASGDIIRFTDRAPDGDTVVI